MEYMEKFRDAAVDAGLPAIQLAILMVVARYVNGDTDTDTASLTHKRIGVHVQRVERSVRTNLTRLIEAGWIEIIGRDSGYEGRSGATNVYRLLIPKSALKVDEEPAIRATILSPLPEESSQMPGESSMRITVIISVRLEEPSV